MSMYSNCGWLSTWIVPLDMDCLLYRLCVNQWLVVSCVLVVQEPQYALRCARSCGSVQLSMPSQVNITAGDRQSFSSLRMKWCFNIKYSCQSSSDTRALCKTDVLMEQRFVILHSGCQNANEKLLRAEPTAETTELLFFNSLVTVLWRWKPVTKPKTTHVIS